MEESNEKQHPDQMEVLRRHYKERLRALKNSTPEVVVKLQVTLSQQADELAELRESNQAQLLRISELEQHVLMLQTAYNALETQLKVTTLLEEDDDNEYNSEEM